VSAALASLGAAAPALAVELTALGLSAWLGDRLAGRRAWPELRTALWCSVLVRPLLYPLARLFAAAAPAAPLAALVPPAPGGPDAGPALALAWAAGGAGLLALALARERRRAALLLAGARPAPARVRRLARAAADALGLRHPPPVVLAAGARGPAVVGLFAPVVVLPPELAAGRAARHLRQVLLHELAHVRRRDAPRALLTLALACAVWWHPAAWIARRRLALQRELACDRRAAAAGEHDSYRAALCALARPLAAPGAGLAFLGLRGGLVERLRRLERPARAPAAARCACMSALAALLLLVCCAAPAARPLAAELPPLSQLEGCLQLRYAVFGLLGEAASP